MHTSLPACQIPGNSQPSPRSLPAGVLVGGAQQDGAAAGLIFKRAGASLWQSAVPGMLQFGRQSPAHTRTVRASQRVRMTGTAGIRSRSTEHEQSQPALGTHHQEWHKQSFVRLLVLMLQSGRQSPAHTRTVRVVLRCKPYQSLPVC